MSTIDLASVLEEAQSLLDANRSPIQRGSRFWFSDRDDISGSPRLTRIAGRKHTAVGTGSKSLLLNFEFTIEDFETESRLHQDPRYSQFVERQVARLRSQQWVKSASFSEVKRLNHNLGLLGWRIIDEPTNPENSQRTTNDLFVLRPGETFDPENPAGYGAAVDVEISSERDEERYDENFDGDFTSVADEIADEIDRAMELTDHNRQVEAMADAIRRLSRISGDRPSEQDGTTFAKNVSTGALRLLDVKSNSTNGPDDDGDGMLEFRFYGNTPDPDGTIRSKSLDSFEEELLSDENTGEGAKPKPTPSTFTDVVAKVNEQ